MAVELDPRITEELKKLYKSLEEQGNLLIRERLAEYYDTFRNRFGPDKLKNLDGEALLNIMHDMQNKDSLVYWLEFKDDEEFPSPRFGSIAGGSSFKFGLFRKKETGVWTTGASQKPESLSIEQAIAVARRNRDQLIRGVELLERLPLNGSDEDYQHLQDQMSRLAPDVSDLAWGHKYFHLLFPEKLDDFHNPDLQRFHLIRLLQLPPQGEGRYVAGGRFVAVTDVLRIPMYQLTSLLNVRDGRTAYSYWRIGTQEWGGKPRAQWVIMRDSCKIRIGKKQGGGLKSGIHEVCSTVSKQLWRQRGCSDIWNDQPFTF